MLQGAEQKLFLALAIGWAALGPRRECTAFRVAAANQLQQPPWGPTHDVAPRGALSGSRSPMRMLAKSSAPAPAVLGAGRPRLWACPLAAATTTATARKGWGASSVAGILFSTFPHSSGPHFFLIMYIHWLITENTRSVQKVSNHVLGGLKFHPRTLH